MKMIKVAASVLSIAAVMSIIGCKGKADEALKACDECKSKGAEAGKCIADVTTKYKDDIGKFNADQAGKWAECAMAASMAGVGGALDNAMKDLSKGLGGASSH